MRNDLGPARRQGGRLLCREDVHPFISKEDRPDMDVPAARDGNVLDPTA